MRRTRHVEVALRSLAQPAAHLAARSPGSESLSDSGSQMGAKRTCEVGSDGAFLPQEASLTCRYVLDRGCDGAADQVVVVDVLRLDTSLTPNETAGQNVFLRIRSASVSVHRRGSKEPECASG
jgi:hypothetical protein